MSKQKKGKEKIGVGYDFRGLKYLGLGFFALSGLILIYLLFESIEFYIFHKTPGIFFDILKTFFTVVVVFFAYKAWVISNKQLTNHIIADLLTQYRSPEMGVAIRRLHEEYEKSEKKRSRLIEQYKKLYETEKSCLNSFHLQRRMVSTFYQHMAVLIKNGIIEQDIINALWDKKVLEIIPLILMPIETEALPHCMGREIITEENKSLSLKLMEKLYHDAK